MQYLGDYIEDYATLNFYFSTHKADGTPATLSDTPAVSVYKGSSTTQSTVGITLNVDFDGVTGLNHVLIDLSADAFYAIGYDYSVVITAGTVDSISVVGMTVGHFSIENRGFSAANKTAIRDAVVDDATRIDASALNTLSGHDPGAALVKVTDLGTVQTGDSYAIVTNVTYGLSAVKTLIDTITNRIGAFTGTGVNTVLGFFKALFGKTATNPSDLGALTFDAATDSAEAIRDIIGTPAGASVSADIAALNAAISLIAPVTHTPNAVTLNVGTLISGTVANMQTDDNSPYIVAPAGGGLSVDLTYNTIGLGRAPISVGINGYFNGAGQGADVWAYDAVALVWDKLSNTSTRMATRNSDSNYRYDLSHDHIDPDTGDVKIRFTSASTNGAHRLNLDRVLVATVTDLGPSVGLTASQVWDYYKRELTTATGDPVDTDAIAAATAALILVNPSWPILTDVSGYVTANVNGSITVSGDVTLAASQPNYDVIAKILKYVQLITRKDVAIATDNAAELTEINANGGSGAGSFSNQTDSEQAIVDTIPTKADIAGEVLTEMGLNPPDVNVASSDDIAFTPTQLTTLAGVGGGDATAANQTTIINAIAALPVPGDATAANQTAISNLITALGTPMQASEIVEGAITVPQALQVILAFAAGKASGGGTPTLKFRDQADGKDRLTMTVDINGNRTAIVLNLD